MRCLPDLASLVTHGANGMCGPPGTASWVTFLWISLTTAAVLLALSRRKRLLVPLVVAMAIPGYAMSLQRADGPRAVTRSTGAVRSVIDAVRTVSQKHAGCVEVDAAHCEICEPIARYAAAPTRRCPFPAVVDPDPTTLTVSPP